MNSLLLGVATGIVPSCHTNGVLRRGVAVTVKPGYRFGGEDGVVQGFNENNSAMVAFDWLGIIYPFPSDALQESLLVV